MTIGEFIKQLEQYPTDKEFMITGYLPEYTYKTKIIKWIETDEQVEVLTDIDE